MTDTVAVAALAGRRLETPVGPITVYGSTGGVVGVWFGARELPPPVGERASRSLRTAVAFVDQATRQIEDYFAGVRTAFDVPLDRIGTPFQMRVWAEIERIPYGRTATYGEVARRLGDIRLSRAVGAASGANPVPILVPCHRLVGSDGSLTGFGGGIEAKAALLRLEARSVQPDLFGGP